LFKSKASDEPEAFALMQALTNRIEKNMHVDVLFDFVKKSINHLPEVQFKPDHDQLGSLGVLVNFIDQLAYHPGATINHWNELLNLTHKKTVRVIFSQEKIANLTVPADFLKGKLLDEKTNQTLGDLIIKSQAQSLRRQLQNELDADEKNQAMKNSGIIKSGVAKKETKKKM